MEFVQEMSLTAPQMNEYDPLSTLRILLQDDMGRVDQIIDRHLSSSVPLIPTLARHLIYAGGKRLRPLLTLACYRLFNDSGEEANGLAAAVEFIHTATLLHDDVIDESKLRRGQVTANHMWGNQASVLVGDFLFARSFQLMIEAKNVEVLKILSDAAACISEGEVLQLSLCQTLDIMTDDSLRIIEAKTAALFAAACEVGTLLSNETTQAKSMRSYGLNLGMAFQIVDDILDYSADEGKLGKDIGNDFREGKITLPLILTYPHCSGEEKDFFNRTLIEHHQTPDDLSMAINIIQKHKGLTKAYELAATFADKARQSLENLPPHPIKDLLEQLVAQSLQRQF